MKTDLIHKTELWNKQIQIDSSLSFNRFLSYVQERLRTEKTFKRNFYQFIIEQFDNHPSWKSEIDLNNVAQYELLFELIYISLFAPLNDENTTWWGLGLPMSSSCFYGTDAMHNILRNSRIGNKQISWLVPDEEEKRQMILVDTYTFILEQLYHYPPFYKKALIQGYQEEDTRLEKYLSINLDLRFVTVHVKGPLPELNITIPPSGQLDEHTLTRLQNILPLTSFHFEGFSVITATDTTEAFVLESIRNTMATQAPEDFPVTYNTIFKLFQSLVGTNKISFGALPFLEINQQLVFSYTERHWSHLIRVARNSGISEKVLLAYLTQYRENPRILFYGKQYNNGNSDHIAEIIRQNEIQSLALVPIFHNNIPIGILEMYSNEPGILDQKILSGLDHSITLFAQLLYKTVHEVTFQIDHIIKKEFTSLQPSVEWKFKTLAWNYMKDCLIDNQQYAIGTVSFNEVYPLYGAIDIRNSTLERSKALKKDLQLHLMLLLEVLPGVQQHIPQAILAEKLTTGKNYLNRLSEDQITTEEEISITQFLEEDIQTLLSTLPAQLPDYNAIHEYIKRVNENAGIARENRMKLERSMQRINAAINERLQLFQQDLQKKYPCYFESFRTDGMEYDIYLGQSIAPKIPFSTTILYAYRFAQLSLMCDIVNLTHSLATHLEVPLQTTQLIFVNSHPIDITFRKEERRFDVEGTYNIRYQIVKKRIDKVRLKDTTERLTQPGKIAIVYFGNDIETEYTKYIHRLTDEYKLSPQVEYLELEELQGVSGLKAIRITL